MIILLHSALTGSERLFGVPEGMVTVVRNEGEAIGVQFWAVTHELLTEPFQVSAIASAFDKLIWLMPSKPDPVYQITFNIPV